MAGRKSIESVLMDKFNVNYFEVLKDLNSKNMDAEEIREYFLSNYRVKITNSTIRSHVRKIDHHRNGRRSILDILKNKGIDDFKVLFESLSEKSLDEIKQYFISNYNLPISEGTIISYFKKYDINFKVKESDNKLLNIIENIHSNIKTRDNSQLLIEKKFPVIRWFNPTNNHSYIYVDKYPNYLIEVKAYLEILSKEEGYVKSFVVVHHGKEEEKSDILFNRKLVEEEILILNDFNFLQFCKSEIKNYIEELPDLIIIDDE
jgi:hypothetical protein